jgi:two-component system, cell cycle sensor histidine kinase and response regulator CckA
MGVEIDDAGHTWIEGDAVQLSQVLMNLVVNAREAMPEGGRLRLCVKPEAEVSATDREKPATIPFRVRLRVNDEGCGMAADVLRRVCDPFFTTKERGQGTGLGMSVVHGIVDAHPATVHITSEKGKGTQVAITFPGREPTTDCVVFLPKPFALADLRYQVSELLAK